MFFVSIVVDEYADGLLCVHQGKADVIFSGRMFQKNPGLVWSLADDLGVELHHSRQIGWGFQGRAAKETAQEKQE